ncbi:hypothetical protein [Proteiniborus sp. MB09-C3]|uniref:hypothetical protein n=1 Tax=Proteiniborus sp. MB09-C3 TaxID=3050072 RepID=UPI0025536535|nr:hypothetical protein [Proteiniborus sp. MB09-C3]WIV11394.1 hypothetical protein QO263_15010 [Proteiniborus sp. MB09-C3]
MQKKKIGIITFAITLISLGILLLMKNFTDINLKIIFAIAWPSIIILFGIEIIITKFVLSRRSEDVRTYVDPLSVIMLCIIIIIMSIYSSFNFDFLSNLQSFDLGDFSRIVSSYKDESTYNYTFTINTEGKDELQVLNSFGNVEIIEGSGDNIEIAAKIKIRYNDKTYADELSKNIVKIDESGSSLKVLSDLDNSKYDRDKAGEISVSYDIHMPAHIKANIENKFGNTTVKDIKKDVKINNQHGNIEVADIIGAVKLDNSFGSTIVDNISEDAEIDSKHGDVVIDNVSKDLTVNNSFGSIKATNIKGSADISNQHNSVYVENVEKDVKIKNQFGWVDAKNIGGNLNIESEHDNVNVENIKGELYTYNKFGNISVNSVSKYIKIISNNGNISFKTNELIEKGIEIENEFGNIDITVPSDQKGSFNVVAEFGEIKNRLGLNVTEGITDQSINDFIDNSNIKFYIRSRNGNIDLNTN